MKSDREMITPASLALDQIDTFNLLINDQLIIILYTAPKQRREKKTRTNKIAEDAK